MFDPEIVLSAAKNLGKSPIMCFSSIQKISSQTIRIIGALVFLCTFFVLLFVQSLEKDLKEMRTEFERNSEKIKVLAFLIFSFNQT